MTDRAFVSIVSDSFYRASELTSNVTGELIYARDFARDDEFTDSLALGHAVPYAHELADALDRAISEVIPATST
ncbi:hypothetical protein Aph01nite_34440 [Acrocarpospora phusangensis]|uniref:Uncharacterized protein n=1 Tax=Acrocarpospora phusangensis TaxID=1070424 RepID=A0A919QCE0_9ACTN|nr:hypothetical protein [Acrocarpospora phusangensis]GIH25134.1 hypothetical protein Aph01nite_34440 [Acrocarpospora phusangensis]